MFEFIALAVTTLSIILVSYISVKMGYRKGYIAGSRNVLIEWRKFNERYGVDRDES